MTKFDLKVSLQVLQIFYEIDKRIMLSKYKYKLSHQIGTKHMHSGRARRTGRTSL